MGFTDLVSKEYTGSKMFSRNKERTYFMIQPHGCDLKLRFGTGNGFIDVKAGVCYAPEVAPTTSITVMTLGDYVVVSNV